jgi:RNA polymerase sigma-70 factor, ECF subfamily
MSTATLTTTNPAADRFHKLVWPHTQAVLHTARLITHNDTDAEDLAQETMLKAFRRTNCLRDDDRARPWLLAILRNTHIDRTRVRRRHELSLDELEFEPADPEQQDWSQPQDPRQDPDAVMETLADPRVIAALHRLPRDIRWTLLLVDVEGLSEADAASALRIPIGTVKSRLHRGRNQLRQALDPVAREFHIAS